MAYPKKKNKHTRTNRLMQLDAIRSPCLECEHHLKGYSKLCKKCESCKKRIAYDNFIYEETMTDVIDTYDYRKNLEKDAIEPDIDDKAGRHVRIDWEEVKASYIERVVTKKIKLGDLAKEIGVSLSHLCRKKTAGGWPKIRKDIECNSKSCHNIATINKKCRKCYDRARYLKRNRNKKDKI